MIIQRSEKYSKTKIQNYKLIFQTDSLEEVPQPNIHNNFHIKTNYFLCTISMVEALERY